MTTVRPSSDNAKVPLKLELAGPCIFCPIDFQSFPTGSHSLKTTVSSAKSPTPTINPSVDIHTFLPVKAEPVKSISLTTTTVRLIV